MSENVLLEPTIHSNQSAKYPANQHANHPEASVSAVVSVSMHDGQPWRHTYKDLQITGVFYEHPSNPNAPVIHFLHGNGLAAHTYWSMLSLLRKNFALCLTDSPGHGQSPIPEKKPGWSHCAQGVMSAVQQNKRRWSSNPQTGLASSEASQSGQSRQWFALAHSMGGVITTEIVSKDKTLFEKVLLLDPVWFTKPMLWTMSVLGFLRQSHRMPHVKQALKRRDQWESREKAAQALRGRGIYKGWTDDALQQFVQVNVNEQGQLITPVELEAWYFGSPHTSNLWSACKRLTTAIHVIYGDKTYDFVEVGLTQAAQKSALITIEKTSGGHCFMLEHPESTAQTVQQYFSAV